MFKIPAKDLVWAITGPQAMGIINCTSDSFYAASRQENGDKVLLKVAQFIQEGAVLVDIGAQSTRPKANIIGAENEMELLLPILKTIRKTYPDLLISVDTFYASVAATALDAGANIINDISCGSFDPEILNVVANYKAGYIGMHLTGTIDHMHEIFPRENLMDDLVAYFVEKKKLLSKAGIHQWVIDPGFGFGKTVAENFELVKQIGKLKAIGLPILIGASRKSSIYKTLGLSAEEALNGTTMVNTVALMNGVNVLRVHDVKEAVELCTLLPYLN
ncbi:MAG: dihydropteroate synthase [Bacteroidetes bacterium]|nr:dihydropteroate synthase [Bacteroidota bacterium]